MSEGSVNWICIGRMGKPHGVRGSLFLQANDRRSELGTYKRLGIEIDGTIVEYAVADSMTSRNLPVVTLTEVIDRNTAEVLVGAPVYVHRGDTEDVEDGILIDDLIGLKVFTPARGMIGEVIAIHNFGAQDNLEIQIGSRTVFYPYLEDSVLNLDLTKKRIEIVDIPEFLDE